MPRRSWSTRRCAGRARRSPSCPPCRRARSSTTSSTITRTRASSTSSSRRTRRSDARSRVLSWEESRRNLIRNSPDLGPVPVVGREEFYLNFSIFPPFEPLAPGVLLLTGHGHPERESGGWELPRGAWRGHGRAWGANARGAAAARDRDRQRRGALLRPRPDCDAGAPVHGGRGCDALPPRGRLSPVRRRPERSDGAPARRTRYAAPARARAVAPGRAEPRRACGHFGRDP